MLYKCMCWPQSPVATWSSDALHTMEREDALLPWQEPTSTWKGIHQVGLDQSNIKLGPHVTLDSSTKPHYTNSPFITNLAGSLLTWHFYPALEGPPFTLKTGYTDTTYQDTYTIISSSQWSQKSTSLFVEYQLARILPALTTLQIRLCTGYGTHFPWHYPDRNISGWRQQACFCGIRLLDSK